MRPRQIRMATMPSLVISCEHGGCEVPLEYRKLFVGQSAILQSHRGWDPGALELARQMARRLGAPLHSSTMTRLLVDLNRSIGHRQLFSEYTRPLKDAERQSILERYYRPHRRSVEADIDDRIARGQSVLHIASHSFTPQLDGDVRRADVAWLYDPRRSDETLVSERWKYALAQRAPDLLLRRNYPYEGRSDGLTSALRKRHPEAAYIGIELEVNQRFVEEGGARWSQLRAKIIDSLVAVLNEWAALNDK
jgi:predicted N-formylglutamate amidohydrolase